MDYSFLAGTPLFLGSSPEEVSEMLGCLEAKQKSYKKGSSIYREGEHVRAMGIVMSGGVNIERDDLWGNKIIFGHVAPGEIFAETYSCISDEPMMVSVVAGGDTEVLFLTMERLLRTCSSSCTHHGRLIRNLLTASMQKNLNLSERMMHTSAKTIRGRLLSFLSAQVEKQRSSTVTIPFNRQQLADYLNVDRSALSAELGKMKREGFVEFTKNRFTLIDRGMVQKTMSGSEKESRAFYG